ncbi:hypothetical protein L1049_017878 [Liquidambar formosana]|uniref:Thioesterase domain-containing protein n=1 Tax=Liquidambar formosana TaxID=63359 RepID=A0AAP0NJI9_LIQFO
MARTSNSTTIPNSEIVSSATISEDLPPSHVAGVASFFRTVGVSDTIPANCATKDFYSDLIRGLLKIDRLQRGRLTCLLSVKPVVTNFFGALHGGAVAAVSEMVSIACARTVVAEDKDLFLGEMSISYLSAAPRNVELTVDGSVIRSGRNLTIIAVEFRLKETGKLVYTARATFYNMPVANL